MAKRHKSVFAPCRRHLRAPTRLSRDVRPAARGLAPLPDSGGLQAAGRDSQAQRCRLGGHCWAVRSHRQLGKTCGHWVGSRGFPGPGFLEPCRQSMGSGFRPSLLLVPWAVALGAITSAQLDIRSQPSGDSPGVGLGPIPTPPPRSSLSVNCSPIHSTPRPASLTQSTQDLVRFWGAAYTEALENRSCLSFLLHSPRHSAGRRTP